MKRILFPVLVAAFALVQPKVMAQPTITAANSNFQVGSQFQVTSNTITATEFTTADLAGANQTWNFAALTSAGTQAAGVLARSAAPNAAMHPAANMALNTGAQYLYLENNGTSIKEHGAYEASQNYTLENTDPAEKMRFPITFNDTFTDAFAGSVNLAGTVLPRNGTVTVTAEAYGTLITPAGTFQNVLKIKTVEAANPLTLYSENTTTYDWLQEGTRFPLLRMTRRVTLVGTLFSSFYLNTALGTPESRTANQFLEVFPNPARAEVTVRFKELTARPVKLQLLDLAGRLLADVPLKPSATGDQDLKINLSDHPKGIYLLKLETANGAIFKRFIVE